jgi:hypothetical protein
MVEVIGSGIYIFEHAIVTLINILIQIVPMTQYPTTSTQLDDV